MSDNPINTTTTDDGFEQTQKVQKVQKVGTLDDMKAKLRNDVLAAREERIHRLADRVWSEVLQTMIWGIQIKVDCDDHDYEEKISENLAAMAADILSDLQRKREVSPYDLPDISYELGKRIYLDCDVKSERRREDIAIWNGELQDDKGNSIMGSDSWKPNMCSF